MPPHDAISQASYALQRIGDHSWHRSGDQDAMIDTFRSAVNGGIGSGKRLVQRTTTDPRTDLLWDELRKAPHAEKPAIAERLFDRLGAAEAEYPWHVAPRAQAFVCLVIQECGLDEEDDRAVKLYDRREAARERRNADLRASALAVIVSDIQTARTDASLDADDQDDAIERIIRDSLRAIGRASEMDDVWPKIVAETLFRAAKWRWDGGDRSFDYAQAVADVYEAAGWDKHDVRRRMVDRSLDDEFKALFERAGGEAGARARLFDFALLEVKWGQISRSNDIEASGVDDLSDAELYEVDVVSFAPCPWKFGNEQADRENADRRAAAERMVVAAEAEIGGNLNLMIEGLLGIAIPTAWRTSCSGVLGYDLQHCLVAAFGKRSGFDLDRVALLIEWSIEEAREPLARPHEQRLVAAQVGEIAARRFDGQWELIGPIFIPGVDLEMLVRAPAEPANALAEVEAASARVEVPAAPMAFADHQPQPLATAKKLLTPAAQREVEMEALTHVPGLVGDFVDWVTATSMNPNRILAFAGALALVGTLAGRIYQTKTGLRTNIYTLGLAPSAFGKDRVRSCINILVERAKCGEWLGGSEIQSGTGMRRRVEDHPAIMWMIDEFGHMMRKMGDEKNPHFAQIGSLLLQYFEAAGDVFRGADYAGERGKPVFNPNVSIFGLSNPGTFWNSCRGSSTTDGVMGRLLPFAAGEMEPVEARPVLQKDEPPAALIDALRNLTHVRVGGNLNGRTADSSTAVRALIMPFGLGAEDAFYAAKTHWKKAAYAHRGRPEESIFGRIVENGLKVAMIIAIGVNADEPVITVERFEHGLAISRHCAETTLREIKNRLADNDRQREHVDVLRMIVEAGWTGIGNVELRKRIRGRFTERRLSEILQSLEHGSKEIVSVLRPTKGRPAMRYVAVESLSPDEVMK